MVLKIKEKITRGPEDLQRLVSELGSLREELREKDQKLSNIEAKHRNLVKLAGDGIATFDLKGIITSVNPSFLRLTGFSADEVVGRHISKLPTLRKIDMPGLLKIFNSLVPGKAFKNIEFIYKRKDGKSRNGMVSLSFYRRNGKVSGVQAILSDITDQKKIKDDLIESEKRYRNLVETAPDGIIIADKKGIITSINHAFIKLTENSKEELIGKHFLKIPTLIQTKTPEYLKIFTTILKGIKQPRVKLSFKRKDGAVRFVEVDFGIIKEKGRVSEIQTICRDITRQEKADKELKESYHKIERTLNGTVNALASMAESRDPYTAVHQKRVTRLAVAIAQEMGLDENIQEAVRIAALVHDIGKINVPSSILTRPGKISEIEFDMTKIHPQIGYEILKNIDFPWPIADIILQHHEKLDGSGYPKGLKEKDITIEAKILAVADVVEAMSSNRPYRPALGLNKAIKEITNGKGKIYGPVMVDSCLKILKGKKLDFFDH